MAKPPPAFPWHQPFGFVWVCSVLGPDNGATMGAAQEGGNLCPAAPGGLSLAAPITSLCPAGASCAARWGRRRTWGERFYF